jgi:type I restriction enzyme, S subunit
MSDELLFGFPTRRLKFLIEPARPITYGIVQCGPHQSDGVPYIRPVDMTDEGGVEETSLLRTDPAIAAAYARSTVQAGDLVISIGPSFGKLMIVPPNLAGANLTQGTARIAVARSFVPRFVFWTLRSIHSFQQWQSSVGGATFRALNLGPLAGTLIPAPDLATQKRIGDYLDRQTVRIDGLIKNKQRQIELLQEKRAALVSHAVTKGLDPNVKMKESGVKWLGKIPEHWEVKQLRRAVRQFVDYRGRTPEKVESGIPLITARNIKKGSIDFSASQEFMRESDYESWMVRGWPAIGDVIVTTEAPLGEVAQVTDTKIALAQRIILLKLNQAQMLNEYLKYYFLSLSGYGELWSRATGSTALGIKAEHFKSILVLKPPPEEQETISKYLDDEIGRLERPRKKIESSITKLAEYRTALISAAVTGKIHVREETA